MQRQWGSAFTWLFIPIMLVVCILPIIAQKTLMNELFPTETHIEMVSRCFACVFGVSSKTTNSQFSVRSTSNLQTRTTPSLQSTSSTVWYAGGNENAAMKTRSLFLSTKVNLMTVFSLGLTTWIDLAFNTIHTHLTSHSFSEPKENTVDQSSTESESIFHIWHLPFTYFFKTQKHIEIGMLKLHLLWAFTRWCCIFKTFNMHSFSSTCIISYFLKLYSMDN